MSRTTIREVKYKAGYVVRSERLDGDDAMGGPPITIRSAYNMAGDYIGDPKSAYRLCQKRGIKPERASDARKVCSIGFSEQTGKWYGWSHRAICGFAIGDVVKEGDCTASSGLTDEYLAAHPDEDTSLPIGFTAETLDDAKKLAVAFAESVS